MRVLIGARHLKADASVMRVALELVDHVQLGTLVVGVMDARYRRQELKAQLGVIAQHAGQLHQLFGADVERDLVPEDVDRARREAWNQLVHPVGDGVEPAPERLQGSPWPLGRADHAVVAGGVRRRASPHALTLTKRQVGILGNREGCGQGGAVALGELAAGHLGILGIRFGHRISPFISMVLGASSAVCSLLAMRSAMFLPIGQCWMSSRILNTASISWSGFGGQPGM